MDIGFPFGEIKYRNYSLGQLYQTVRALNVTGWYILK